MAGTPLKNLRLFEKLCGKEFSTIVLTTTMWDEVDLETGEQREQELQDIYWKAMIDRGSTVKRFLYTQKSAFDVLRPVLSQVNKMQTLRLQNEVTDLGLKLKETAAGRVLALQLEELVPKQQRLLMAIRNDLMESSLQPDQLEQLHRDFQEVSAQLQRAMRDVEKMKISVGDQFLNFVRIKIWNGSRIWR
jgi:methyl-accepting chemotaxis protein